MSRALNLDATVSEVLAFSAKHKAEISAIELLDPRGTRVVFVNGSGAAAIAKAYGAKVMTGPVTRQPWAQQAIS
jgi:hypothetical protein